MTELSSLIEFWRHFYEYADLTDAPLIKEKINATISALEELRQIKAGKP